MTDMKRHMDRSGFYEHDTGDRHDDDDDDDGDGELSMLLVNAAGAAAAADDDNVSDSQDVCFRVNDAKAPDPCPPLSSSSTSCCASKLTSLDCYKRKVMLSVLLFSVTVLVITSVALLHPVIPGFGFNRRKQPQGVANFETQLPFRYTTNSTAATENNSTSQLVAPVTDHDYDDDHDQDDGDDGDDDHDDHDHDHDHDDNELHNEDSEADSGTDVLFNLPSRSMEQVRNYRSGSGFMVNVHITHHGGTTFCSAIGHAANRTHPHFNCMLSKEDKQVLGRKVPRPWTNNETASNVAFLRQYFHMISWEFSRPNNKGRPLSGTFWEHPNLVSVIIMRDPISRLLAGDAWVSKHFPKENNRTEEQWWEFAKTNHCDNFALRILAGNGCCNGERTKPIHYENAKALVDRFTFVLDIACLDEGMAKLAEILGITPGKSQRKPKKRRKSDTPSRDRIDNDKVYNYLLRRNYYDVKLYEWSKSRSLVNCSAL